MAWPLSKHLISTDDQIEISGTKETIRKDRMLQNLSRLRWEKPLRDELGRLKTEEILSEKRYTFDKHYYETKLKGFKGRRILSGIKLLRDRTMGWNLHQTEGKAGVMKRVNNVLANKWSDSTLFLPRKELKWSLNDTTETEGIEQEASAFSKIGENNVNRNTNKLPRIYNENSPGEIKTTNENGTSRLEKRFSVQKDESSNVMLRWKGLPNNFPQIVKYNH